MTSTFQKYLDTSAGEIFANKYKDEHPREHVDCIICGSSSSRFWYAMGLFQARICKHCKTRFISPRFNDEQLDEYYSEELFTQSRDYEGVLHNMLDPKERERKRNDMRIEIETVLSYFHNGAKVLDIGCQTGIFLESLPDKYGKYGVERSSWAAQYCETVVDGDIRVGKVEDADYPVEYFDVINMSYVVEHLQYPLETMSKIVSWLKKDGILIISIPNFSSFCSLVFREFYRLADPRQHIYLTTKQSLTKLLNKLNFLLEATYYPYWNTPYCNRNQLKRLFANTIRRLLLPVYLKIGFFPSADKVVSPPFWGNIMTVVAKKK
jgi:2-polyprenyl-3-methyl-5-hydroxy-6-metoxy-1,4-benzoquinol methylase